MSLAIVSTIVLNVPPEYAIPIWAPAYNSLVNFVPDPTIVLGVAPPEAGTVTVPVVDAAVSKLEFGRLLESPLGVYK